MIEDTQKRYADDVTVQELVRLRVENERLREALQKIVDHDWSWEGGGKLGKIEGFCAKIARSALQQKDNE